MWPDELLKVRIRGKAGRVESTSSPHWSPRDLHHVCGLCRGLMSPWARYPNCPEQKVLAEIPINKIYPNRYLLDTYYASGCQGYRISKTTLVFRDPVSGAGLHPDTHACTVPMIRSVVVKCSCFKPRTTRRPSSTPPPIETFLHPVSLGAHRHTWLEFRCVCVHFVCLIWTSVP